MLFDGAVAATVVDATQADSHATADAAAKAPTAEHASVSKDTHGQTDAPATPAPVAVPGQTVVFVDARVKDSADLLKGAAPGTQVVQLDASKDGLQQMADYLGSHQGVSSVQIIAHGNTGDLWLGSTYLSADNVAARSEVLAQIGQDMNVGGDILIYACNTAQGTQGLNFVDSLAQLTGRDIAASTNRTGGGGDWTLEIATGSIESHTALSYQAMSAYQYGLATITVTNNGDSGAGSLRQALSDSVTGDTVTFNSSMTVNLNSQLVITKNVTVAGDLNHDGVADVTLSGQYKTQVLRVNNGVTATLDGLVITQGLAVGNGAQAGVDGTAAMGGGIVNFGNLTLNNVTVTSNAASGGGGGGGVTAPYAGGPVGGGGGGGGALGGQVGGHGGIAGTGTGVYAGTSGSANTGGTGGSYSPTYMGGKGGSNVGGAGAVGVGGYSNGGAGGTANNGTISIGGGGGGSGWDRPGRAGASASGGIYNATSGTLTVVGTSVISNNIAAGGGGGGGGGSGGSADPGGAGGKGVGAIWNKGTLLMTAANFAALSGNVGGSGSGGQAAGGGATGASVAAVNNIFNDGGTLNTAYAPTPSATIVVTTTAQHIGSTSLVTITFSQAVTGFTNADLTVSNGTLSAVSSSDGGVTWTATFTPNSSVTSATNHIVLDNTGVTGVSNGLAGSGTSTSNNYTVDTVRPTATVAVVSTGLNIGGTSVVNITFSEAVSGFSLADMTASNGTLSNLATSDNIHWTATLTPTGGITSGTNVITLDNTLYTDASTNTGTGVTTSNNYSVDTVRPTASIVVSNPALNIGGTSLVTITFSEAVSGFTNADLVVADGTLSAVSSSDGGITWTATLTPSAGVSHSGDVITLSNTGVADLAGNTGSGTTSSNAYAVDTLRPNATIVFSNTTLAIGQTSLVTITFSEAVSGFTNADLTITNGTLSAVSSSDGGVTWTATFTPTASITSPTNHITLDKTGVQDLAGNAGSGTTNSNNVAIDTQRPTATIVVANPILAIGQTSLVTVTFSEAVTGFTNADLTIANGTLSAVSSSDGGITWTATFTPSASTTNAANHITLDNTGYSDQSGNTGTGTTDSNNFAIDTQRPTATIVIADPVLSAGETTLVTITFSEAVSGFTNADLTIANGTLTAVSSSDGGITWTATLTPTVGVSDATNVITLANAGVADLAGNAGSGTTSSANYTVDTVLPTATIVVADSALKIGETSAVTITFSEAVTGFTNADLTIANGTLTAVSSSDGGITWTATFTPSSAITDATNLITLDNSGVRNLSGNAGSGTTSSNNYAIDTQRPTATIVVSDTALGIGQTSLVTVTFSEAVTGFTNADLTIANGTLSAVSSSDGGITWTATLTPAAGITDTSNVITLDNTGVADLAGNAGGGTTDSNNYAVDSQRPTATIVVADSALTAGETSLVTITFSEAVTGFTNSDLSVPNGTLSAVSSADGGVTWTATFSPNVGTRDATNLIILDNTGITDLAGNAGSGTTSSANFTIDTVRPTATIVVADNAVKIGDTSLVTITFSEAVSGFTNADLTVANGTLTAVSSSDGGITWTATFTPTNNITDTTNLITLDNSGVQNASGNAGSGTTDSNNYAIDTQRPTATIVVANATLNVGQTSLVTITFSEAISGFSNADLIVANGTLSTVNSSDGGVTWTATLIPFTNITNTANTVRLDNSGIQDAAGNIGTGTTDSNNYVIDTQRPTATIVIANPNLNVGGTSLVTVTFSEPVTGFSNSDLLVSNGTLTTLSSADGGRTWTGVLTPNAGFDTTGNVISLNNSGVQDLAGNIGVGSTLSNAYNVHTSRPVATIKISDPVLNKFERQFVTIEFSEPVLGFSLASLQAANGTFSELTMYSSTVYSVLFTPDANTTASNNVITLDTTTVRDAHGNAGIGNAVSPAFAVDTVPPTATLTLSDTLLEPGESAIVTVTFSERVTGFDNRAIVNLRSATLSTFYSPDGGMTWQAALTPTPGAGSSGSYLIGLSMAYVRDLAGNFDYSLPTPMVTYQVDHTPLTANLYLGSERLTSNGPTTVSIYFNKPVTNFDLSDLSADNGVLSNLRSSDGGFSWQATLTPFVNTTSAQNIVRLNNAGVTYNGGSTGVGITTSRNYTVDTLRPTSTIVIDKTSLARGDQATVTVTFSEAVAFYNNPQAQNAWLSELKTVDGGITWIATLTPQGYIEDTSNVVTLDNTLVHDLNGNAGLGISTSNNYAIDTRPPTATIVVDKAALAGGDTANVTITFNEAVSGLKLDNLRVYSGVLSNLKSVDGGITWTATLTPKAHLQSWNDLVVLNAQGVTDAAGNTGQSYTYSNYFSVDTQGPQVYIEVSQTQLKAGQGTEVFIWFSEPVRGFNLSNLTVQNGTLSNLQSGEGGYYWIATLTPNNNVNVSGNVISVDNSTIRDLAGNAGEGISLSNAYAINSINVSADPLTLTGGSARPGINLPNLPLRSDIFAPPTGNLGSPLTFAPLFEQRVLGDGIRPLGDIFINNGAISPSFIAQVFTSSDNVGEGSGEGFLGFGGGDGGIFGSSTLSSLFSHETHGDDSTLKAFDSKPINGQGDPAQGLRGVFGAPSLGQQLQQLKDTEQRQVMDLAHALQQVGISEMQA
ncbi:glycosyl hydrolase [Pseudomonas palleroniana]|uniref:Glycosyl hydrolase n=2 Tax=Pseudomonas palleroniana TaxID=191390 RepID=A0A0X7K1Q3_9PSED|nr:glycosyl hydrolase [Pseudomonas palleroniana]